MTGTSAGCATVNYIMPVHLRTFFWARRILLPSYCVQVISSLGNHLGPYYKARPSAAPQAPVIVRSYLDTYQVGQF